MEQGKIMEAEVPAVRGRHPNQTNGAPHNFLKVFTGQMPFLPPNQQRQSTDGFDAVVVVKELHSCKKCYQKSYRVINEYRK